MLFSDILKLLSIIALLLLLFAACLVSTFVILGGIFGFELFALNGFLL